MPSQPFSASFAQNSGVTAASVAIIWRTNLVSHSLSRNLRAVSRSSSCSSVKPMSIGVFPFIPRRSQRHRAGDDARVHAPPIFLDLVIGDGPVDEAPVVPHHQVAPAPAMDIDEWPLR